MAATYFHCESWDENPQFRAKASAAMRKTNMDPHVRERRSQASKAACKDPETIARRSAAMKVRLDTHRNKMQATFMVSMSTAEAQARRRQGIQEYQTRVKNDPLIREARRSASQNGWVKRRTRLTSLDQEFLSLLREHTEPVTANGLRDLIAKRQGKNTRHSNKSTKASLKRLEQHGLVMMKPVARRNGIFCGWVVMETCT